MFRLVGRRSLETLARSFLVSSADSLDAPSIPSGDAMTDWRGPEDRSHLYIVNPWQLAAANMAVLWACIFGSAHIVEMLWR